MARSPSLAARIRRIDALLARLHGPKSPEPGGDPLDELILTILSQNTNDRNRDVAWERMRAAFPTWEETLRAPLPTLARAIRPGGLAPTKARRIKAILAALPHDRGALTLDFLRGWPDAAVADYLRRFPGVGPKTVACVLLFALGRSVLPVDTHILRVSKRLGLIPPRTTAEQAHDLLQRAVPADLVYQFHLNLIEHGRTLCKAGRPRCAPCPLSRLCPSSLVPAAARRASMR